MVGIRTPLPRSACVRSAQGSDVWQGGAQPDFSSVLGLHVAARHAAALVLRVQPEVYIYTYSLRGMLQCVPVLYVAVGIVACMVHSYYVEITVLEATNSRSVYERLASKTCFPSAMVESGV